MYESEGCFLQRYIYHKTLELKLVQKSLTEVSSAGAVLVSVKVGKLLRSHARALHLPEQTLGILSQNKTIIML
jgi:hypothetical protein